MKKLLYTSLIALAGLFAASCQQEHIEVVYDPANVTVQTLGEITGVELSADGEALTTTFNPADFKLNVASGYTLYAASSADMTNKVKVSASISIDEQKIGHISIKQPAMNSLIYSLGGVADEPFTVYFQLDGSLVNDKNTAISATIVNSNVVTASFTPYSTVVLDKDLYPHVYPIGGIELLGSWGHEKVFQFIYDYNKSTDTYTGLLDLGEDHASGVEFKFTGEAGWDDSTGNWGVAADQEVEGNEIQLENGSSTNISQYGKNRFYMFSLNTTTLVLTKKYSFDNVGIVGAFNGWDAADANMKMTYNVYLHRFYIDQTFDENTELKFTCDDNWNLNWGGEEGKTAGGGANIAVEAGSYRIYLDLNKETYEFSTSMYGKVEPTGKEDEPVGPVTYEGWGVVGTITGWAAPDIQMTTMGNFWVAKGVELTAEDQFKFRKDEDWTENIGAAGDVEPFVVETGAKNVGVAGGKNLAVSAAGTYDLYVNPDELSFYVMAAGDVPAEIATWGVVGTINGWGATADLVMTEENGMLVHRNVALTTSDQFKIRYKSEWDENRGGPGSAEPFVMGTDAIQAVPGGKNLGVAADGDYDVWYDALNEVLFVVPAGQDLTYWGIVGNITNWGSDRSDYIMYKEGDYLVRKNIELPADAQYKIRYCSGWDVNRGAPGDVEPFKVDANVVLEATPNGKNLGINEAGTYDIYYKAADEKLYVMAQGESPENAHEPDVPEPTEPDSWGLVGSMTGWGSSADIALTKSGSWYVSKGVTFAANDEFKIRGDGDWTFQRGAEGAASVTITIDEAVTVVASNGQNMVVPTAGTYDVYWDTENEKVYVMTEGKTPEGYATYGEFFYAIGGDTGWSNTYSLRSEQVDGAFTGKYKGYGYLSQEFKFKPNADNWDGDLEYESEGKLADIPNGPNCPAPAAGFYMIDVDLTAMTYKLTLISTLGIIGPAQAGGWDADTDLTYNIEGGYWEASNVTLSAAEMKFRANDAWDMDWGGSFENLSFKGGNITAQAGTYNVKVYLICETKSKAELTAVAN